MYVKMSFIVNIRKKKNISMLSGRIMIHKILINVTQFFLTNL